MIEDRVPEGAEPPADDAAATSPADAARSLDALDAELASVKDRLLRVLADQENTRRRTQREQDEFVRFAVAGIALDLLPTADNLRRAIESVVPEQATADSVRQLLGGVVATERALLDTLRKHGVERLDPLGETFDPNRHEAVYESPDAAHPAGTVIAVLQPGYLHHERLLRPAMVGVAQECDQERPHDRAS
jgi:molecular chaperone GrpE